MTTTAPPAPRRRRLARTANLAAGLALAVVLALNPPPLPQLGPSLATPLTTTTLTDAALVLAWTALVLLAAALLQRGMARTPRVRPTPAWSTLHRRRARPVPRPLVPQRRPLRLPVGTALAPDGAGQPEPPAEEPAVPSIMVRLLGPVTIDGIPRPRRAATTELIAYLALHPAGAGSDQLLEALWPGQDPRRTRPRLWQSTSEARRLLADILEHHDDRYRLKPGAVTTDVHRLQQLLDHADHADPDHARVLHERAVALLRGDPFTGTDYAWSDPRARDLHATIATLLERAAHARLAADDPHGALRLAERGLALDDLNETFLRLALDAEAALGHRDAINTRYESFRDRLDQRLGLQPERETRNRYRALLGQN